MCKPRPTAAPVVWTASDDPDDLTPVCSTEEMNQLAELRVRALEALGLEALPEDGSRALFAQESLLRYVRARPTIAASVKMLLNSIEWRREYDIERNLREWQEDRSEEAEWLRSNWPCGVHGVDKRGCPVYYARYGRLDFDAVVKRVGFERVLRCALSEQRQIEEGLLAASRAAGKHLVQVVCVADFEGLAWSRAARSVKHFRALSRVLDDHFPERLHVGFVARAPRIFSGIYAMASPFLAADTKAKVRVCGASADNVKALSEFVAVDNIPTFMGGQLTCGNLASIA
mmetsp:Transcript_19883/g.33892  ORF Transcript_19883/g.33892 Transcript_19883/m.33892 type:complete len:287 (-) Transcript_19883:222-1082(-)